MFAAVFLAIEGIARLVFATQVGPRILLYGTPWHRQEEIRLQPKIEGSVQAHQNHIGDYSEYRPDKSGSYAKYFPHEKKFTASPDEETRYPVRINNHGFRGADFEIEKPAGTRRVLTLGASSTFGYHNRNDETYPFVLERTLNRETGGSPRFEVVNFAIAHAITDNIVSMFLAEGVQLTPDYVTLYAGVNDSAILEPDGVTGRAWFALRQAFVLIELAHWVSAQLVGPARVYWSDDYAARRSRAYLDNVRRLEEECRRRGIVFIVASQQATALLREPEQRKQFAYRDEVALVRERSAQGKKPDGRPRKESSKHLSLIDPRGQRIEGMLMMLDPARILLVHSRLMSDLHQWASASEVGYVDVIGLLDGDRDLLLTYVHLAPEANRIVAEAFADVILRRERARGAGPGAD